MIPEYQFKDSPVTVGDVIYLGATLEADMSTDTGKYQVVSAYRELTVRRTTLTYEQLDKLTIDEFSEVCGKVAEFITTRGFLDELNRQLETK